MENQELTPPIKPKKKKKINWWKKLMVIIPILFLSTWALSMWNPLEHKQPEGVFEVSGYTFYELPDNTYGTYVVANGQKIPVAFRLDPRNASEFYIQDGVVNEILKTGKTYITFNPNQEDLGKFAVASAEIARITGLYGINTVGAYTEDSEPVNPNIPLRTCDDVSNTTSVILMQISNETGIYLDNNNCVHVNAENPDELILVADKLGFHLLGLNV